jgi:hypothetical protein
MKERGKERWKEGRRKDSKGEEKRFNKKSDDTTVM